ncbi:DNA cytosine methyltransferase [Streptomyces sp. NPDC059881]|uniref:DNA cytosine methyltransferase n=1 Tax=Streptomyces sp. NPDC059881 TaxID=3346986 RepID=UPI003653E013
MSPSGEPLISVEICAGAGGQAIGLHGADFRHVGLVEIDTHAVGTLKANIRERKEWGWERDFCDVIAGDVKHFKPLEDLVKVKGFLGRSLRRGELHLLAGGVPCPPFSHAGKQLGKDDERDLFPEVLRLVDELLPKAVMIENVRGIKDAKFDEYRRWIEDQLSEVGKNESGEGPGYEVVEWDVLEASDFGVPQLRPRAILVAFRRDILGDLTFVKPKATRQTCKTVWEALRPSMRDRYGKYLDGDRAEDALSAYRRWYEKARGRAKAKPDGSSGVAPTLVGGSKKHGGADLGPSRAKAAWRSLGVNGLGVANDHDTGVKRGSQDRDLFGGDGPMLTVEQAAIIQGFPDDWHFAGLKTAQYRQVGNAFPPPVAEAVGKEIAKVLRAARERDQAPDSVAGDGSVVAIPAASAGADRSRDLQSASV